MDHYIPQLNESLEFLRSLHLKVLLVLGPWSPRWCAPPVAGALRPPDNLAYWVAPPVAGALRPPDNLSWRLASFAAHWAFASTRVVSPGGGIVT